jgi:hypothetical protein
MTFLPPWSFNFFLRDYQVLHTDWVGDGEQIIGVLLRLTGILLCNDPRGEVNPRVVHFLKVIYVLWSEEGLYLIDHLII